MPNAALSSALAVANPFLHLQSLPPPRLLPLLLLLSSLTPAPPPSSTLSLPPSLSLFYSLLLSHRGATTTTLTELDRPRPPRDLEPRREEDDALFPEKDPAPDPEPSPPSLCLYDDTAVRQMAARGTGGGSAE